MIRLDEKYVVDVDEYNYRLAREKGYIDKRTGKPQLITIGYFRYLDGALKAYGEQIVKGKLMADCTLEEAIQKIHEARDVVHRLIDKVDVGAFFEDGSHDIPLR